MKVSDRVKKVLIGVLVIGGGLLTGTAASLAVGAAAESPPPAVLPEDHSAAAYDRATVRFTGSLGAQALAAVRGPAFETTVLVVLRGSDVKTCEDLGRQIRELYRAVPEQPGWGMAILIDPAGEAELRRFLAKERIPRLAVVVADPAGLLADGGTIATPAALIADSDGRIRAGVAHPSRFKNVRGRSFAEELPWNDPGST